MLTPGRRSLVAALATLLLAGMATPTATLAAAPVAVDDVTTTLEDTPKLVDVLGNDTDADLDPLTVTAVTQGAKGDVTIAADGGSVTYTPHANAVGADTFTYTVGDGLGGTDGGSVDVTITAVQDPPVAVDDSAETDEDTFVDVAVAANDSDPDGDALAVTGAADGTKGSTTVRNGNIVRYTPNADVSGSDTFTYTINDGHGNSDTGSVFVTIDPINDPPSFTKGADQAPLEDSGAHSVVGWATGMSPGPANEATQTVSFQVTADSNPGLFSVAPAVAASGTLSYTLAANAVGNATIGVRAVDNGGADSAAQTFTIAVTAVNDVPSFAKGANQLVAEDSGAVSVSAWATAIDPGPDDEAGQTISFEITSDSNPSLFSIVPAVAADGTLTFTTAADKNGTATIGVRVHDGGGTANGGIDTSAIQTFTITITASVDTPVCPADTLGATEDVVASGSVQCTDPDPGDTLTYELVTQPAKGAVVMASDGTFTYKPVANANGADSFTYRARDTSLTPSSTATVSVTIAAVNDPPTFTAGANVTVAEDSGAHSAPGWATAITVGPADETLTQTPAFTITADSDPSLFSVLPAVSPTGTLTFTGKPNANGTASLTVSLSDGAATAQATFTITISPAGDPPNAVNDVGVTIPALAAATAIPVLANDLNPDPGETLSIASATQGAKGKVAITGGGTGLTYAPTGCNTGTDTFTYTVSDGNGGSDTATVLLTITKDTVKPVATAPRSAFVVGNVLGTTSIPVRVSWCATDPGSGVARYQLAQSTGGGAFAAVSLSTEKATSITRSFASGHHYQLRVRGIDGDGSVGAYATGPNMLAARVQETSTAITTTGTWTSVASGSASGGKVKYATAVNASATFTFTGRAVAVVSPTSSSRGSVRAYVDGVLVATVSERTSSTIVRRIVFARTLTAGSHTLKLVVVGNGRIDLDAIVTLS